MQVDARFLGTAWVVIASIVALPVGIALGDGSPASTGERVLAVGLFVVTLPVVWWLLWTSIREVSHSSDLPRGAKIAWVIALLAAYPIALAAYWRFRHRRDPHVHA